MNRSNFIFIIKPEKSWCLRFWARFTNRLLLIFPSHVHFRISEEVVGKPGTFCLLVFKCYVFGLTTLLGYLFFFILYTVVGKNSISDAASVFPEMHMRIGWSRLKKICYVSIINIIYETVVSFRTTLSLNRWIYTKCKKKKNKKQHHFWVKNSDEQKHLTFIFHWEDQRSSAQIIQMIRWVTLFNMNHLN